MFKGLLFFLKFGWKTKKEYIILNAINQFLIGFMPLILITIPKYVIDELFGLQRMEILLFYLAVLLLAVFLNSWLIEHINLQIFNNRCYVAAQFSKYMHEKLANTDYLNLEMPDFFETKEKASKFLYGDWRGFSFVMESAFAIIGKIFTLVGIITIISTMNIWLVLIFLAIVFVSAFFDAQQKEKSHKLSLEAVAVERRWNYFSRILEDVGYSKEIRMNTISHWLINKELEYSHQAICFYVKRNKHFSNSALFSSILNFIQNVLAYAYLIFSVINRGMSVGAFTMYVNAVNTFSHAVKDVISSFVDIKVYGIYYEALDKYLNIPETLRENKRLPIPHDMEQFTIEFKNVSFKYPGQSTYAVKNINLKIESGTKISVVGENGAGKTTFIKLLCRLYDPTEGEILLNETNIKDIDYDQYMSIFSAVFQDFKMFAFSIAENIVFNQISEENKEQVEKLLEKVGMKTKIQTLENGIETNVHKEFDEKGFEPSGGEAQKIAIARALARQSKFVILDEPLSALDPKAEDEIFLQFNELVNGKTAVYISHRMSASQICDKIIVFANGEIIEQGTHKELIEKRGKYEELYHLQAKYYTSKGSI